MKKENTVQYTLETMQVQTQLPMRHNLYGQEKSLHYHNIAVLLVKMR